MTLTIIFLMCNIKQIAKIYAKINLNMFANIYPQTFVDNVIPTFLMYVVRITKVLRVDKRRFKFTYDD